MISLYGTMQGIFYDTRSQLTTSGHDLASILRAAPSAPHPSTARTERGLDDLHVSPSTLSNSSVSEAPVDESKIEVLCRCNGQRIWVPGKRMKGHVCQNTSTTERQIYMPNAEPAARQGLGGFEMGDPTQYTVLNPSFRDVEVGAAVGLPSGTTGSHSLHDHGSHQDNGYRGRGYSRPERGYTWQEGPTRGFGRLEHTSASK